MGCCTKKFASKETTIDRICLQVSLRTDILKAYHDDLGHQGRERTMSLVKRRFIWPGMDKDITDFIHKCGRCFRRKTANTKSADLANIVTKSAGLHRLPVLGAVKRGLRKYSSDHGSLY